MKKLKISIITVCYNAENTIEQTVLSVINQSYDNIEYIVIDGLSKDKTINILSKYQKNISKIISENDSGLYDAMNKGIKLASGDVIGFINADDFFSSKYIVEEIMSFFNHSQIKIVYGDLVYVHKENANKVIRYWKSSDYKKYNILKGWMPAHPTFYARKELYQQNGLFNTEFKISSDYDLMLRFLKKVELNEVKYIPIIFVLMRSGGISDNSIKTKLKAIIESIKVIKNNKYKLFFISGFLKPLRKIFQFTSSRKLNYFDKYRPFNYKLKLIGNIIDFLFFPILKINNPTEEINKNKIKKILVNDCFLIGDNIMTTALLNNLKFNFPNSEIHTIGNSWTLSLYSEKLVDKKYIAKTPWSTYDYSYSNILNYFKLIWELRRQNYDLALETRGDWRNCFILWLTGAKYRYSPVLTGGKVFVNKLVNIKNPRENLFEIRRKIALSISRNDNNFIPNIPISHDDTNISSKYILENKLANIDYLILHPGASLANKMLNSDQIMRLILEIRRSNLELVIVGGPKETFFIDELKRKYFLINGQELKIFKGSLNSFAAIIKNSLCCITMDSAAAHISSAMNKPTIIINKHDGSLSIKPYGSNIYIINFSLFLWETDCILIDIMQIIFKIKDNKFL